MALLVAAFDLSQLLLPLEEEDVVGVSVHCA